MQNIQNIADESSDDEGFEVDENVIDSIAIIDNSRASSFFHRIVTFAKRNPSLISCSLNDTFNLILRNRRIVFGVNC